MAKTVKEVSRSEADKLWLEIQSGFANLEALLLRAVETRSWTALGYTTFTACWEDRLKGIRLAQEGVQALVIYQMLEENLTDSQIIEATGSMVTRRHVENARVVRSKGLPYTMVSAHPRKATNEKSPRLIVLMESAEQADWVREAFGSRGKDWNIECQRAIIAAARRAERVKR